MSTGSFFEVKGLTKRYGGVAALSNVDFSCEQSSIHGILGENGAGKSTLIKIISGVVLPDAGQMQLQGRNVSFRSPPEASREGIFCIFQELSLIPDLSVAENICITNPPRKWGLIDKKVQITRAEEMLARLGCEDINPREQCRNLSLSRQQMVEIAKALGRKPKMLILDEATSAIAASDVEKIFTIVRGLREEGLSILYITHKLQEAESLCDICSVFRNGERIKTFEKGTYERDEIVQMMIGRSLLLAYPEKPKPKKERKKALEVEGLNWGHRLLNISFCLGEGEIVGLGGLDGQGQREILLALFGTLRRLSISIKLGGRHVTITSPTIAKDKKNGIAMIPEDRKNEGLLLPMSVRENISLSALKWVSKFGVLDPKKELHFVDEMARQLRIKVPSYEEPVGGLSGGNQQKVVIAKWLLSGARCLLLMDPTRGIDVGTKQELYRLFRNFADQGTSILFYSSDYEELIGLCDRVIVLYDGRITKELYGHEITERNIIEASLNLNNHENMACAEKRTQ
jgi:ribose transport system ATP-binding protein